jgi:hypothetical protein
VRRHAAYINAGVTAQFTHADPVAEDRAAREGARGVDGDDANLAPGAPDCRDEFRDQCRFAAAGNSGDAHHVCPSGQPEYGVQRRPAFVGSILGP